MHLQCTDVIYFAQAEAKRRRESDSGEWVMPNLEVATFLGCSLAFRTNS